MPLAALNFSDPVMLLGLLAAGIPVMLHLLNRIRSPVVQFPTLRFLRLTAQKTSRRRHVQHFLLLLLRMAVFALIAMAIAGPLVHGGSPFGAYGMLFALLAGLALMAVMGVMLASAFENKSGPSPVSPTDVEPTAPSPQERRLAVTPSRRFLQIVLPALVMLIGLLAVGGGLFGLSTNKFFPDLGGSYNGESTACVVILDNSQSMLARDGIHTRLDNAISQTHALLNDVIRPAQMGVLLTNPGHTLISDHVSANRIQVLARVAQVQSAGRAIPMRELISRAVKLLETSDEPNKMLIVISDFAGPASSDVQAFAPLKKDRHITLVLMPQELGMPDDVAISRVKITTGQPVVGSTIYFSAHVVNNGQTAVVPRFDLLVNSALVPHTHAKVQLEPAGGSSSRGTVKMACLLTKAGYQVFTIALKQPSHVLPWADQRSLVLKVSSQARALVVGAAPTISVDSTAFFVDSALAPLSNVPVNSRSGKPIWSIVPKYCPAADLLSTSLSKCNAVFMCDVPKVNAAVARKLHRYVQAGGRICWLLGPAVDSVNYNQELSGPQALLPAPLTGPVVTQTGSSVDWVDIKNHIFAGLFRNQNPFRRIVVVGRWGFSDSTAPLGHVLSKLRDNGVFLAAHRLGQGTIYTFLTAPGGDWTNFANTSSFLPMIVRMALGNAGDLSRLTSYEPEHTVQIPVPSKNAGISINVDMPGGTAPVNVQSSVGPGGRPQWLFTHTLKTGMYHWQSFDHRYSGEFLINPPTDEANLFPVQAAVLAKQAPKGQTVFIAATARQLLQQLEKISHGTSLMPGVLAIVLILAVLEALLANRYKPMMQDAGSKPATILPPSTASAA